MAKFEAQNLGIILTRQGKEREEYSCSVRKQEWTEGVNGLFCNEKRMKDVRLREEASEMRFTKIRSHERIVFFFDFTFWEKGSETMMMISRFLVFIKTFQEEFE